MIKEHYQRTQQQQARQQLYDTLHAAVDVNDYEQLQHVIRSQSKTNTAIFMLFDTIDYAIKCNNSTLAQQLLDNNQPLIDNIKYFEDEPRVDTETYVIQVAMRNTNRQLVRQLLATERVQQQLATASNALLRASICGGDIEIIDMLLAEARVAVSNNNDISLRRIIELAIEKRREDIVQVIVQHVTRQQNFELQLDDCIELLQQALHNKEVGIVKLLLQHVDDTEKILEKFSNNPLLAQLLANNGHDQQHIKNYQQLRAAGFLD